MNTLFWCQNETPTMPNTIGIDGKIFSYKPDLLLDKAVAVLMNRSFIASYKKKKFQKVCQKYDVPENFILVWNNDGLLIQSIFQNLDEGGTPLTFRFWCKTIEPQIVCGALEKYAELLGRKLRNRELEDIRDIIKEICVKQSKSKKKKLWIFFIVSILILLFFIWKNCCMDKSSKLNKTNVQEIIVGKEMQNFLIQTYK